MGEIKKITIDEYKKYDSSKIKKYWEWRKRALLNDRKEVERIRRKIFNQVHKLPNSTSNLSTMENQLILKLENMIKKIKSRKLINFKVRKNGI